MTAVRVAGVSRRFGSTCALDGVDLTLEEGEVRGLLGPNGAGKTTLLRILFGLVRPDSGSVELFDRPLHEAGSAALKNVAGFVEDPSFYPYLSGRANLELMAELDGAAAADTIGDALARVGLSERGGDRVSGYSSGMRQRLGIAAALLRAPRLLLLDEPTAGLDPEGVRDMDALIGQLSADGVAILVSSHQIGEVEGVCDSFTMLRSGRVVWDGTREALRAQAPASAYRASTSDDVRALSVAAQQAGVVARGSKRGGLEVSLDEGLLDRLVLALASAGVAVRRLELLVGPLEAMFFSLTSEQPQPSGESGATGSPADVPAGPISPTELASATSPIPRPSRTGTGGVRHVLRVELRKLAAQLSIRLLALVCVLAPFVFAAILKVQSGSPNDTIYGVWVHSSGFALSLVTLAFAGSWGFPLMAGIVSGDMFSADDRYGTWKLVLTRSCTRAQIFTGKVLAGAIFVAGLVLLIAASSLLAGALLVGAHPLVSLSGTLRSPGALLLLVLISWLLCVLPALAFASLGVLFSLATRNGIMGVIGPALVALAMQLLILVGSGIWAHMLLVASAFNTWHGLLTAHRYYGPLLVGIVVSIAWSAACLGIAWRLLRRRDFAGTPVGRRQGWVMPVRVAVALTLAIAFLAFAGSWGPAGVTATRLQASLIPTFNQLTLLQQRELGRAVPPGAKLNILPACGRRGSAPRGPGDWVCTLSVIIPSGTSLPPEPTIVSYDVSVQPDGCYKAQSPPAFIGQQLMRDAHGHNVVNPLFTIYGCFNPM